MAALLALLTSVWKPDEATYPGSVQARKGLASLSLSHTPGLLGVLTLSGALPHGHVDPMTPPSAVS